jgi:hypothetical protein
MPKGLLPRLLWEDGDTFTADSDRSHRLYALECYFDGSDPLIVKARALLCNLASRHNLVEFGEVREGCNAIA